MASLQRRNWFLIGLVVGCLGGLLWIAVVSMMADPANIPHSAQKKRQARSVMADVDPLKPGQIKGQNPNTPELDAGRMPNRMARIVSIILIPLALIIAWLVIYSTMVVDPGSRPVNDPQRQEQK